MNKIIDCITFFNENFIFDLRYQIIKDYVTNLIICESEYDHRGKPKKLNFNYKKYQKDKKIIYIVHQKSFKDENPWANQATQREFILENISFVNDEDYIFFSDPDEIPNTEILKNFKLSKKYGIFFQKSFNYKFNLFNEFETPWEGTRVCKKKNLKSIDYMRQKVLSKNLNYSFFRLNKEKNIEIFKNGGWHFNNILSPEDISLKLKTFAHSEFASEEFSSIELIRDKIEKRVDLFNRQHKYEVVKIDNNFPTYIINNSDKFNNFIV